MSSERLLQFQCQKEGTLFYYQTSAVAPNFDWKCPLCGSKRVIPTGRVFKPVNENAPMKPAVKRPARRKNG